MGIKSFEEMEVWQKAHQFALDAYALTRNLPDEEKFGVAAQIRRAAVSVPCNIAEGFGRRQAKDKCRFYNIAEGSVEELKYLLRLSLDLAYLKDITEHRARLDVISSMLRGLIRAVGRDA